MPQSLAFETDAFSPKRIFQHELSMKEDPRELLNPQEAVLNPPVTPTPTLVQKIVAEMLGTGIFVFVGGANALAHRYDPVPIESTALVWGLSFMVLKYSLAHISGAFMNPASTIAFAIVKKVPWRNVPIFILCQLIGSTLAALTLRLMFHSQGDIRPAVTQVIPPTTLPQAVAWEFIITFILTLTSASVATDTRAHKMLFGLAIGAVVIFNVIIAGDITGGAMNPARSIGPAVVAGEYKDLWVYIVGPGLGATSATLTYDFLRLAEPEQEKPSTKNAKIIFNELYTEPQVQPSFEAKSIEKFRKVLHV